MKMAAQAPPEGFRYLPNFLGPEEHLALLRRLEGLEYTHDRFRGRELKRGYAQFGRAYVSSGRRLELAPPLPEFLAVVVAGALPHCPPGSHFDQCIVTQYPPGAGIGWHTDAPRFGDCIAGVSVGAEAKFQFRANGSEEAAYEQRAAPGSLYVMSGPARGLFQHQVVPVKALRYSLTFRSVADGPVDGDA